MVSCPYWPTMLFRKPTLRIPSLPILTILATVLTLLVLLAISTYRNIDRERRRMEEFLFQQGVIVIRGLEAGARAGMMRMMWREDHLQALVEEVVRSGGLAGVRILEADGQVVADSHPQVVSQRITPPIPIADLLSHHEARGWRQGDLYIVGKRFVPMVARGMMGHGRMHRRSRQAEPSRVALVEMFLEPYLEAQRSDIRHAFLMGLVLLVLGSASFYFIFVVQNLHLVRRTLQGMTTYMAHVVEHMPDGLISIGPNGEILRINGQARELLGLQEAPIGKTAEALGDPWGEVFREVQKVGRVQDREIEWPWPSGELVPVAVSASQVQGSDGEDLGVVILIRDLREVRDLQAQIQRSERLAALGQLAAGVAHEIRNPLSSIRGFAQFFKKRFPSGTEDKNYADVMVHEVDRLNRVITNLLDFARPKEPVMRQTRPREMVEHAMALIRKEAETRGVKIHVEGDVTPRLLDPDQMTQALLNLLLNAMEGMSEGGDVHIVLESREDRQGWTLEVRDTGPGISPEALPRLFDPFFTTKKRGTGLGLAIVHRIVENHGGTIEAKSETGKGTRFVLRFPAPA